MTRNPSTLAEDVAGHYAHLFVGLDEECVRLSNAFEQAFVGASDVYKSVHFMGSAPVTHAVAAPWPQYKFTIVALPVYVPRFAWVIDPHTLRFLQYTLPYYTGVYISVAHDAAPRLYLQTPYLIGRDIAFLLTLRKAMREYRLYRRCLDWSKCVRAIVARTDLIGAVLSLLALYEGNSAIPNIGKMLVGEFGIDHGRTSPLTQYWLVQGTRE